MLGPQENVTLVVRETLNILLSQLLSTKQLGVYPLPPRQISRVKGKSVTKPTLQNVKYCLHPTPHSPYLCRMNKSGIFQEEKVLFSETETVHTRHLCHNIRCTSCQQETYYTRQPKIVAGCLSTMCNCTLENPSRMDSYSHTLHSYRNCFIKWFLWSHRNVKVQFCALQKPHQHLGWDEDDNRDEIFPFCFLPRQTSLIKFRMVFGNFTWTASSS